MPQLGYYIQMQGPAEPSTAKDRAEALSRIARMLTEGAQEREALLRKVSDEVRGTMRTTGASLLVLNDAGDAFAWTGHVGVPAEIAANTIPRQHFELFREQFQPVLSETRIEGLMADPQMRQYVALGLCAHATAIVSVEGRVAGLLVAASYGAPRRPFLPEEETWLQTVADIIVLSVERERAMRDTQRSEARYKQIVTSIRDGVWSIDAQGRTNYVNAQLAQMLGYTPEEMVGRSFFDFMDEDAKRQATVRLAQRRQGISERHEMRYRRKDGSDLTVMLSSGPLKDASGAVSGALAVVSDLTEVRAFELKMQQAQKLESLGVLAGGIAHDFNNLLVGIMGNVGLALDDLSPTHQVAPRLEEIRAAALRAAELTRQMLAYSGKGRFVIQRLDLSRLVDEMSHLLTTVISKHAVVRFDFSPKLPAVEVDATQIRQVVMNLITNASDALGDEPGTIAIRTGVVDVADPPAVAEPGRVGLVAGRYVVLEVADTGCGMDARTQEKMFDPFFTTKFAGRGLGLAAVHGILRGHRGAVQVESEPGRGTRFKVLLPVASGAYEADAFVPASERPEPSHGLLLVADDEPAVRAIAKIALERAGFRVLLAEDGRQAVDLYAEQPSAFAAVLLDLTMPKLSGEQVLRELQRLDPRVRVVLSSGYTEQDAARQLEEGSVTGFLQKPWHPRDLVKAMSTAVAAAAR
jgi:two-component system cell cycle sensor histidine kinase/response regulator CckA